MMISAKNGQLSLTQCFIFVVVALKAKIDRLDLVLTDDITALLIIKLYQQVLPPGD